MDNPIDKLRKESNEGYIFDKDNLSNNNKNKQSEYVNLNKNSSSNSYYSANGIPIEVPKQNIINNISLNISNINVDVNSLINVINNYVDEVNKLNNILSNFRSGIYSTILTNAVDDLAENTKTLNNTIIESTEEIVKSLNNINETNKEVLYFDKNNTSEKDINTNSINNNIDNVQEFLDGLFGKDENKDLVKESDYLNNLKLSEEDKAKKEAEEFNKYIDDILEHMDKNLDDIFG